MYIPTIGTKGKFIFLSPYDNLLGGEQEYTVDAIRSLSDLANSGEKPYETIYKNVGLTTDNFKDDLDKNVFIVTFKTTGGENFYVPANKISSLPVNNGVKYQDMLLVANLGALPIGVNTTLTMSSVAEIIYDTLGIKTNIVIVNNSAVSHKTTTEHTRLKTIRDNIIKVTKSYKTKYKELLQTLDEKNKYIKELEKIIIDNGF